MTSQDRIDIDIFKVISRSIAESDNLQDMSDHLTQLLVMAMGIKGATLFVLNPDTGELEVLSSTGLSLNYLNKGPILIDQSIDSQLRGEPIVIGDVTASDRLQYPEDAKREGIGAIVSVPVQIRGKIIGRLRLYHYEPWQISERDLDSLQLLAEIIAVAMEFTRMSNILRFIKSQVDEVGDG
jgi:GAF domain-containing protein